MVSKLNFIYFYRTILRVGLVFMDIYRVLCICIKCRSVVPLTGLEPVQA